MQRRDFITLLGGATATWPLLARAQQPRPVIGFLCSGTSARWALNVTRFRQGLKEVGFVDDRDVSIEYRWAEGQYGHLPALASDLVKRRVSVIFATGSSAPARYAKAATATIPIVFESGGDPVAAGLVASLNRPGGNVTGVTWAGTAVTAKRLEVLHQLVPEALMVGALVNPDYPDIELQRRDLQEAADAMKLRIRIVNTSTENNVDGAFATLAQQGVGAIFVANDPFLAGRRDQLIALSMQYAVPTIYPGREYVAAGGLISYGADLPEMFRLGGIYAGQILKGAKPADLPVLQPTKFDLVINLKTAKALGLNIPPSLLALADEVIE